MTAVLFLKLGGSLITDKTGVEAVRTDVLHRVAQEISQARQVIPDLQLLLGHGSGSFGHVAATKYGTRHGVHNASQWHGFAKVSAAALRLNRLVVEALLAAGVPAISLSPSASVQCVDGRITEIAAKPIQNALAAGLVPVVYGDVAFDTVRGGTIISTEEIMMALVGALRPSWLLLSGETAGVLDTGDQLIPQISTQNYAAIEPALGGSRGADVTGGMATKVQNMLSLVQTHPELTIRIFSGLAAGVIARTLAQPAAAGGTVITSFQ
ncbi:MAG: isopentenyl phosphate kinase family protein [Chloroflexi bacterium]|nr:isopentenyl phosphate kinase family protein [Chloroflexota bacterium]